ncbi:MAG: hypothetical protein ACYTAN_18375 [Planctomycetota bacterium]
MSAAKSAHWRIGATGSVALAVIDCRGRRLCLPLPHPHVWHWWPLASAYWLIVHQC